MDTNTNGDDLKGVDNFLLEFQTVPVEPTPKRRLCDNCRAISIEHSRRPVVVCWCQYLHKDPIDTDCTVVILQHPSEEKQCLRTAPILMAGLAKGKCIIIKGRKFSKSRNIHEILGNDPILVYPGKNAVNLCDLPPVSRNGKPYTILIIDGTWPQAKSIYHNNPYLHEMRQVKLSPSGRSEYVIKTQPTEGCLSTVESAALTLSMLEEKPYINKLLLRPLHALCDFQLQHGAVEHRSKEFKIFNGSYSKPLPQKLIKKMNKVTVNET